jgi:3',5'-cyclic AMP phosphodiesterase CpdA
VTQQAAWLDDQLSKAQEKFIFVVFHHPPYTISNRHRWEERRDFHLRIRPLLVKYAEKITSLVVGHDHLASMIMLNNTPMIVSGATWETQTPSYLDYKEGPVHIKTVWNYRGHVHWVRLDILPATHEVWVNFVNAQTRTVSCSIRIAPKPLLKRPNCQ